MQYSSSMFNLKWSIQGTKDMGFLHVLQDNRLQTFDEETITDAF